MASIGFDLDGVLYPWQEVIHKYCLDHNLTIDKDPKIFWTIWARQHEDILADLVNISEFYLRSNAYAGSVDMVKRLSEKNKIYYITSRPDNEMYTVMEQTFRWLNDQGFPQTNHLIFTKDKPKIINRFEIDMYVEDRVELAQSLYPFTQVFLVNKPYNLAWEEPNDIIRIDSVTELERFIK